MAEGLLLTRLHEAAERLPLRCAGFRKGARYSLKGTLPQASLAFSPACLAWPLGKGNASPAKREPG